MGILKDFFYEFLPDCENCGEQSAELFCRGCLNALRADHLCLACGAKNLDLLPPKNTFCQTCERKDFPYQSLHIAFEYRDGVAKWIRAIKDHGSFERILEFRKEYLPADFISLLPSLDSMIVIPADPNRFSERLFDTSEAYGRFFSGLLNLPLETHIFERAPFLASQHQLDRDTRQSYLHQVIRLRNKPQGKRVLLMDDVLTTGVSLNLHASLLQPYVQELHTFCLARTPLNE